MALALALPLPSPPRRKASGGVHTLRAIPWIFAWTQTRMVLPAWLGVADALMSAVRDGKRELLRDMYEVSAAQRGRSMGQ